MATLAQFKDEVFDLVRPPDGATLPEDVITRSIDRSVDTYSLDSPRVIVSGVTPIAAISSYSLTTNFATWNDDSEVLRIERPINKMPPELLIEGEDDDFIVEQIETGFRIHFDGTSSQSFRLMVSVPWTLATLSGRDTRACAMLAAYYCAVSIAAHYGQTIDPTIGADIVDRGAKSDEWSRRANDLLETYKRLTSGTVGKTAPVISSQERDLDSILGPPGTNMFTHPRRFR